VQVHFTQELPMNWLSGLFGRQEPTSRQIAKNRLQLVLVQDRMNMSPQLLQTLKDELIAVISKYVDIDVENMEVTFTQNKRQNRLTADIPVIGARSKR
jgi:cell division topological specificity factor